MVGRSRRYAPSSCSPAFCRRRKRLQTLVNRPSASTPLGLWRSVRVEDPRYWVCWKSQVQYARRMRRAVFVVLSRVVPALKAAGHSPPPFLTGAQAFSAPSSRTGLPTPRRIASPLSDENRHVLSQGAELDMSRTCIRRRPAFRVQAPEGTDLVQYKP